MNGARALLEGDGFWVAFGVSVAAVVVTAVLRRATRRPVGSAWAGVVGAVAGLAVADQLPARLLVAVVALAVGGALLRRPVLALAVVPGALLIGWAAEPPVDDWMRVFVALAVFVGAPLTVAADRRAPRLTGPLLAITALGVYWTTPDTEHAIALAGGLVALAVASLDPRPAAGAAGAAAVTGLVLWTGAVDGYGRAGAVVGAAGCLGILVLLPLLRRAVSSPVAATVVLAAHLGLVAWESRVAGLRHSALAAAGLTVAGFAVAGAALLVALPAERGRATGPP